MAGLRTESARTKRAARTKTAAFGPLDKLSYKLAASAVRPWKAASIAARSLAASPAASPTGLPAAALAAAGALLGFAPGSSKAIDGCAEADELGATIEVAGAAESADGAAATALGAVEALVVGAVAEPEASARAGCCEGMATGCFGFEAVTSGVR